LYMEESFVKHQTYIDLDYKYFVIW
jgi:hypothetical protein